MSDKPRQYGHTPIPTADLSKLIDSTVRIEARVSSIADEQLPAVSKAATEARDGVIRLTERDKDSRRRIDALEDAPLPTHKCDQEGVISANEREIAGLSKWRWWLMGLLIAASLTGVGAAVTAARDMASLESTDAAIRRDVVRNEKHIEIIENAHAKTREELIGEIRKVPNKVQESIPEPNIDDALANEPLSERDRAIIRAVLERAERRNGGHKR